MSSLNSFQLLDSDGNYLPAAAIPPPTQQQQQQQQPNAKLPSIGLDKLKFLLDQDDTTLVLELATHDSGLAQHIARRTTMRADIARLTLRCVARLCASKELMALRQHFDDLQQLLRTSSQFWLHVIGAAATDPLGDRRFHEDIGCVVASVRRTMGADLVDPDVVRQLRQIAGDLVPHWTAPPPPPLAAAEPLSIVPTIRDFAPTTPHHDSTGSPEPNRLSGDYASVAHYTHVQMALVRHDLMHSLRAGIRAIRAGGDQSTSAFRVHWQVEIGLNDGELAIQLPDDHVTMMVGALLLFTSGPLVEDLTTAVVVRANAMYVSI